MAVTLGGGRTSSVLVPCLMKVIHIQGHIPYVICTAFSTISGNGELKQQKTPLLMARIMKKRLCGSKRSCCLGKRPHKDMQKFSSSPLDACSREASWKPGPVWGSDREEGSSCYRVKSDKMQRGPRGWCEVRQGQAGHGSAQACKMPVSCGLTGMAHLSTVKGEKTHCRDLTRLPS